jgi:hypothetical protein
MKILFILLLHVLSAPPDRLDRPGWPHLLVESSASVLWLNRVTQWFRGKPLQTPADLV